ncbi:hypothetical protein MGM1_1310 [Candidatus Malacoplasma girerdii]|uniref:Uncharacterized protein n=1 Tax=Candidatus Malacoplasma girerdii TaxID=1318617 RepID=A0A097SSE7_9BACT|nr:hypothetical protein MGM1_1310 [Candidatus Malacoplasma girerdii]
MTFSLLTHKLGNSLLVTSPLTRSISLTVTLAFPAPTLTVNPLK